MGDDPYLDPDSGVLRNKLGLTRAVVLDRHERRLATQRIAEGLPAGDFDLRQLRAIHRHIFQDVYDWAGQIRVVEIAKGGTQFMAFRFIETGMADVHRRLLAAEFLRGLSADVFANEAAVIIGDINHIHPFREGNGRAQLQYLRVLAEQAGHDLDLTRLSGPAWIQACREAHLARYDAIAAAIASALR
ncbi:MAG: Fic family protein [Pseudomonadota bacterium]